MGRLHFSAIFDRHRGMNAKRKRPNTAGAGSESGEQKALFEWWQYYSRSLGLAQELLYAIPNGAKRDAVTASRLRAEGVRAGIPDICLAVARGGFHGLYIEMKRQNTSGSSKGRVSASQKAVQELLQEQGYQCVVCFGAREAVSTICDYLNAGKGRQDRQL